MELLKPGTYPGKVLEHAITETKDHNPQAVVKFQVADRQLIWFGSFKDTVVEHTIKGLVACGLKGNNPGGQLEIGKEVSLVVDVEERDGKTRNRIRWVNNAGIANKVSPQEAMAKLERFAGAVAAYKNINGITDTKPKNHAPGADEAPPWEV